MLFKICAEAEIHIIKWLGMKAVAKRRINKSYRMREIDESLRISRTRNEARLIIEARKLGVPTPVIYDLDKYEIIMEYIDGYLVKDVLDNIKNRKEICRKIGNNIAILHKNDIVHGDLTTSNMIIRNGSVYFIDFSLGAKTSKIEEKGVDLRLLSEAIRSAHSDFSMFNSIIDGYRKTYENANEIIEKVKEIEKRRRYT